MEIKINREIRSYNESVFFGLNLRQLIFSALAVAVAIAIYFGLRDVLGRETVSWVCMLGAAPFGALGFLVYNGMPVEKFAAAYIRSEILMPKQLAYHSENLYYALLQEAEKRKNPTRAMRALAFTEEKLKSISKFGRHKKHD